MPNYLLYAEHNGITQREMVDAIQPYYPEFTKIQMSIACYPERYALQMIPAAEDILVANFGAGPGLSISPKLEGRKLRRHDNKNKPNRMCVRLDDSLRSRVEAIFKSMCFVSYQDMLEAAIAEFVQKHEVRG